MKRSQLAINSVSTRHKSLPQMLDAYRAAGFRNVEFCLPHVKASLAKGGSAAQVKQLLDERELTCIGGFQGSVHAFGDTASRATANDDVIANAELLAALGATTMVVGTDGPSDAERNGDVLGRYAEAFAEIADRIKPTGVTVCIEFNWSPLVKSVRTAAEIARRSGADNVGVLFDPAHYHCTPSKLEQLTADTVAMIRHVHVDDMRDKPAELSDCNSDRVLPGQGHLDLPGLLGRIEAHGYEGYFSIEMFNEALWNLPAEQAARQMYQSMLPLCDD
ncbi:MAG: sugar phosphate isomerase/epimerase family protein [Phycisphaeraceae bacterium]